MATFDLGRVTPIYKGDYSASAPYELNDVVLYNGNLYWHVKSTPTVGILPTDTTVWKLAFADEGVRAEIRGYADNAQNSADSALASKSAAAQSASQASASESHAALSAQTAQTAETGATASAQTASTKASEATASAQSAASSAQIATDKATLASQKAAVASESASLSTAKASEAATSETNAVTAANTATAKASEAAASATSAQEYDESAQQSAVNAQASATNAAASEAAAKSYAEDSAAYLGAYPTDTAEGEIASFSDGADDIPLKSLVVDIDPVQDLHGYDSPWPAGGGKNLFQLIDGSYETTTRNYTVVAGVVSATAKQSLSSSTMISAEAISVLAGTNTLKAGTYTFSYEFVSGVASQSVKLSLSDGTTVDNGSSFTIAEDVTITGVTTTSNQWATNTTRTFKLQIESGTSVTAWSPYQNICPISGWTGMTVNANGTEIPISWESEAGTVYGGTLDVVSGVLTVTKGFIQSYSGEALPSVWISDRDTYTEVGSPTTGAEVCYTLAEPITYQLTPHEVKSLLGTNTIYADTGDATVEYRADTSAYIAKKIAEAISALS